MLISVTKNTKMVVLLFFIVGSFYLQPCFGVTYINADILQQNKNLKEIEISDSNLSVLRHLFPRNTTVLRTNLKRQANNSTNSTSSSNSRRCQCAAGVCKCCTGYVMDLLRQKACMKVTYHPGDFAFDIAMTFNDRILYENSLSGKNPQPICINPPRMPNLKFCSKFYNVFFPGRNFHFCLAMSGQWRQYELFNIAFDCLRMGANGIAMVKPDEGGGLPIVYPDGGVDAVIDAGEDGIEDYDENGVRSLLNDLFSR